MAKIECKIDQRVSDFLGLPDWYVGRMVRVEEERAVLVTLHKCPLITRGKNKGFPNYRKTTDIQRQMVSFSDWQRLYPVESNN